MSTDARAHEQAYVSMLYGRLDAARTRTEQRLAALLRESGGTPQQRTERDVHAARYREQLAQFGAAEHGLCFGRLDGQDPDPLYIGRLGMLDENADYAPLLVDWRAPAARPFYTATAAAPEGVRRRRHIRSQDRTVVAVHDEVLAPDAAPVDADDPADNSHTGDAALLAALAADRTGRMGDIVATIQAEQDRAIRSDHRGVLVVDGGPGTGKTAVALHRAAYLLYTHREQLAHRGVLVIGPNPAFLHYIDQVLPSLGETGVRLVTVNELYPGIRADTAEPSTAAEVKGRPLMAEVIAAAVRDRQRVPEKDRALTLTDLHPSLGYQPEQVILEPAACARARERARDTRRPHNQARAVFVDLMLESLARQLTDRLGEDPFAGEALGGDDAPGEGSSLLGEGDVAVLAQELRRDPQVQAALAELWPPLTPPRLLADLFADPDRLAAAAPGAAEAERRALLRSPGSGWTVADVPLLDEAAELLGAGPDAQPARERHHRQDAAAREYAQGVLDIAAGSRTPETDGEPEDLAGLVTADLLASRQQRRDSRTVAERAAADRRWVYGHVIVDEAQELSPMAWRMVMRRCPSRSMTVVGDLAQTGAPGGSGSWERALAPYIEDRWRLARLTVNYRTPAEIMELAAPVLQAIDPSLAAPRSIRRTGHPPCWYQVDPAELADRVPEVVAEAVAVAGTGRTAAIVPASLLPTLGKAITAARTDAAAGPEPAVLDHPVAVLAPGHAKGLEFDSVVVVEPERISEGSPHGRNDLYVALTRATRWLGVVHTGRLPEPLVPA